MEEQSKNTLADPSPVGLVSVAVATFVFFAMLSGNVEGNAQLFGGIWLLGGFIIQVIVGLVEFRRNNGAGANTFIYFSAFFMFASGILNIVKWWVGNEGLVLDTTIDGFAWIPLAAVTILWIPAFFRATKLLTFIIIFLAIALPFVALLELGLIPASLSIIPAVSMLIAGILSVYLSAALVVNESLGKTLFPIPKPFIS